MPEQIAVTVDTPIVSEVPAKEKSHVFFPNLDGLRFFCFLAVFLYHSFSTGRADILSSKSYIFIRDDLFGNGVLGVYFFFVLSGFLITFLLLKEKEVTGKIHVPNFYIRRILRIWPLFYFCVFYGFVIFPILEKSFGHSNPETAQPIYYLFFLNNFDFIKHLPNSAELRVLWSVAIEEQFYVTWPLLLALTPQKYYKYVFIIIIIGSFIYRAFNYNSDLNIHYNTLSNISDMAVGGLAAYLTFRDSWLLRKIKNFGTGNIALVYVAAAILYFFKQYLFQPVPFLIPFERLIISVVFALIILEQCFSEKSFYKMGNFKLVSKLGQYTYGLYCLHEIALFIAKSIIAKLHLDTKLWEIVILEGSLSFALVIAIAYVSYTFFESRFLKLKNKFAFITK